MKKTTPPSNRNEGNKYDKIIKENLQRLIPALLSRVLNLKIYRIEDLPDVKMQSTLEREPDFLKIVYDEAYPEGRILHLEFESGNETYMERRMLEYLAMLHRKYGLPVEQHLIFLGEKPSTMVNQIEFGKLKYAYDIHNLSEISYKKFINSDVPEEVILSILADREDLSPQAIINLILTNLIRLKGDSLATRKFIKQLEIISKLRNFQELFVQTIDNMSISFDITTDVRFKQGKEIGLEKGLELGAAIKTILAIRNGLKANIPLESIAFMHEISIDYAKQIKEELKKETEIVKAISVKRARIKTVAKKLEVSPILVRAIKQSLRKKKGK